MSDAAGWNLRNGWDGIKVLLLSAVASLMLLPGCASEPTAHPIPALEVLPPVDIYQLAQTDDEVAYLQILQRQNPQWATDESKFRLALGYHRQLKLRTQALAIQFRHQYPSATKEEIDVLAWDAASREAQARQDAITRSILSAPPTSSDSFPVHCFSDKVFGTIYTDCY